MKAQYAVAIAPYVLNLRHGRRDTSPNDLCGESFAVAPYRLSSAIVTAALQIEPLDAADTGRCPCCGDVSRKAWGLILRDDEPHASYFVHWTVSRVFDHGAYIDIILGRWGDGSSAADRYAVSLEHRILDTGPCVTVIDADRRDIAKSELVGHALKRDDVIGGPRAASAFAIYDAMIEQDPRLAALWDGPGGE
jgi:hypothetical protein